MKSLSPVQRTRLQNMFVAAQQARQSGMYAQAENMYRDILKAIPEAWDVHQQLALLLVSTGRSKDAVKHFRLIARNNPTHAHSHANLANVLAETNESAEAITEFKRALALDPKLIGAHIVLAAMLRKTGKAEEAIRHYMAALDLDNVNHAAFNGLGLAYRDLGDLSRALEGLEHAVGLSPNTAEYRLNFGITLKQYTLLDLATDELYEATRLKPDWVDALVALAELLYEQHRYDEAKEYLERALKLESQEPDLQERLGMVYLEMGDTERAIREFDQVLSKEPDCHAALEGKGRSCMLAGDTRAAAETLELLVKIHPSSSTGYYYLAQSRKFNREDPFVAQMEALSGQFDDNAPESINLNFALGKIYDDCKAWDLAFERYAKANYVRNIEVDYRPLTEEDEVSKRITLINREFVNQHDAWGTDTRLPIMIVGMPRSGTTLTEQILSSHPEVVGAGEVAFWGKIPELMSYWQGKVHSQISAIQEMTAESAHKIANQYIERLSKIAGAGVRPVHITDKMPHNFLHLGLIALLFPHVRIVNCKRDPMDNCLSIFFQNFSNEHKYAFDLANIGHHYRQYERLMAHWHEVLPGRILDINYEDTVADPEYWSRKLIEHVGLGWDDACLAPHKLERTVKTASHWQVRQPIYKTSVQRWKHYEKYLGPLVEALAAQD